jgi:hypothetical protein
VSKKKREEKQQEAIKRVGHKQQDGPLKYKPFEKLQRVGNWKQDTQNS